MKTIFYLASLLCVALMQTSCNTPKQASTSHNNVDESKIFSDPYQYPHYLNGGSEGLLNDLYTTLLKTAPAAQECVSGRAYVSFKISKSGRIEPNSIKVKRNRSVPDDYMNAAIDAIKNLGKFEPGKLNGTPKAVTYLLPIIYPVPMHLIKTSE